MSYLFKYELRRGDEGGTGYTFGFCREPVKKKKILKRFPLW
jgi:hypothetical protein